MPMETMNRTEFDHERRTMPDADLARARLRDEIASRERVADMRVDGAMASRSRGDAALRRLATIRLGRRGLGDGSGNEANGGHDANVTEGWSAAEEADRAHDGERSSATRRSGPVPVAGLPA